MVLGIIMGKEGADLTKTRKMTMIAMMISLATIFHWIESMIPLPTPIPGYRLGLSNIVGLVALYQFGSKEMMEVNLMRVLLASLLNSTIFSYVFWMSLCGVVLSSLTAIMVKKMSGLSLIGISVLSAVMHCVGQILVSILFYDQAMMVAVLPYLLFMSIPTGIMTGFISQLVLKRIK